MKSPMIGRLTRFPIRPRSIVLAVVAAVAIAVPVSANAATDASAPQQGVQLVRELDKDYISFKETLFAGDSLRSENGQYTLLMEDEGNLVIYDSAHQDLWSTKTYGNEGASAALEPSGNFVVYDAAGTTIWQTHTPGRGVYKVVIRNDSDLVLLGAHDEVVWSRFCQG